MFRGFIAREACIHVLACGSCGESEIPPAQKPMIFGFVRPVLEAQLPLAESTGLSTPCHVSNLIDKLSTWHLISRSHLKGTINRSYAFAIWKRCACCTSHNWFREKYDFPCVYSGKVCNFDGNWIITLLGELFIHLVDFSCEISQHSLRKLCRMLDDNVQFIMNQLG